jgi:V/A-type H+-transporting ATPase subunit E
MDDKLKELTERIYQEGVERSRTEGQAMLERARQEAAGILEAARAEARAGLERAQAEADKLRERLLAETRLAAQQVLSGLRQNITDTLAASALREPLKRAFDDVVFLQDLVREMTRHWENGSMIDARVLFAEAQREPVQEWLKVRIKDLLDRGLQVGFDGKFERGFRIGPKDGSYVISFTEQEFQELLLACLKTGTQELLFPES